MRRMTSEKSPAHNEFPKGRLDAFTDGVLAIVVTLLVLELKVPGVEQTNDLWGALAEDWRDYAGYLISFVFVGGVWVTHSSATSYLKRGDTLIFRLNLLLLLFVSLLPFLTSLMTTHLGRAGENVATALYGADLFIASILVTALIRYAASQPDLIASDVASEALKGIERKRQALVVILGLSAALAIFFPNLAVALYFVVSLAFLTVPLFRAHQARKAGQAA